MLAGKENAKQNNLPPLKPDEVLPLAKKYVALLSAGEYKAVHENFDPSLQKTITLNGVIKQWEALSAECGKYIRQNEAQALKVTAVRYC